MSQEKVDRYKKEKANREKIMRRERWITRLEVTAFVVVLVALIGWFSMAVYQNSVAEKKANRTTETVPGCVSLRSGAGDGRCAADYTA